MNVAPSGWNPTAASQSELATYGIPPRPASSDPSYGSWIARWANVHFVTPPSFLAVGPSDRFDVTSNWGGYAQKGSSSNPFTTIVSTWTEPADNNSACTTNIAPFWVGIGGSNGATNLIQAGSQIETNLSGNGANQQAWWEDYPAGPVFLPYYAAAGDPFSVDIQYEGAVGGQSFQITLYSPNEGFQDTMVEHMAYGINLSSSAEAVVEMLGGTNGIPLSIFGTLTFSNVYTNVGSLAPTSQAWVISDSGPGTSGTLTKLLSTPPNSSAAFLRRSCTASNDRRLGKVSARGRAALPQPHRRDCALLGPAKLALLAPTQCYHKDRQHPPFCSTAMSASRLRWCQRTDSLAGLKVHGPGKRFLLLERPRGPRTARRRFDGPLVAGGRLILPLLVHLSSMAVMQTTGQPGPLVRIVTRAVVALALGVGGLSGPSVRRDALPFATALPRRSGCQTPTSTRG